jgi:hypothetical protein
VADGAEHLRDAPGVVAVPQEVPALFDDGGGQRVEEPAAGEDDGFRLARPGLPEGVLDRQRQTDGKPRPWVLRHILDQDLAEPGALARDRHRQVEAQRLPRLGLGGQPVTAVDRVEVELDQRAARHHAVVVTGLEGLAHLARHRPLDRPVEDDLGGGVRNDGQLPGAAARALDGEPAVPRDLEGLGRVRRRRDLARPAGDRLVEGERADLAVEPDRDLAPHGHGERRAGDVVEIEARTPGVGRRLDPAFPDRTGGERLSAAARRHLGHARDAPDGAEEQRHDEGEERDVAQREGIAGGDAQVGGHGPRRLRPLHHAKDMRAPDGLGGGIARPDRLAVGDGGERAAGQRPVEPLRRVGPAGPAEAPDPAPGGPCGAAQRRHDARPDRLDRKGVLKTEHQRRQRRHHDRPERPERPRRALGRHAGARQEKGPPEPRGRLLGDDVRFGHEPRAGVLTHTIARQSHGGMVSRAIISSKVGLRRMTAK